jgi:ornithine cyclodeaminase/alanine dehydrogenase-like protein (mu-crystallin family)
MSAGHHAVSRAGVSPEMSRPTIPVRILSSVQVRELLTCEVCAEAIRAVMVEVSRGNVSMPLRHGIPVPHHAGRLGLMYGYLGQPESFGTKLLSLFPSSRAAGLSSHMGLVVLHEPMGGRPVAILEAGALTAIRTAAASAVATQLLARADARILALVGTGEQAAYHLPAIIRTRPIRTVRVWGLSRERTKAFIASHVRDDGFALMQADSVESAVKDADIVCTVTSSPVPVLFGRWIRAGTHVNLVGSSVADRAEVDTDLLLKSSFFVDYRASAMAQAGEFLSAKRSGAVTDGYILGEIGEVISGAVPGRRSNEEITIYKSLGVIAQDLAAAMCVLRLAERQNVGTVVEF